jgi:protein-L-isoaspartate(D-aspartate) O-methyltransferase
VSKDKRPYDLVAELKREGVDDARVLSAIETVPREMFVDGPFVHSAYENSALPIACGQTISQPFIVGFMTQALNVGPTMRVLEVGTGSGYQAAVLSLLCRRVYTVERHKPLLLQAQERFSRLKFENIVTRHGDGALGWPEQGPFDRILITAATSEVPKVLIEQLMPGGSLIAPVGRPSAPGLFGLPESFSQRLTKMIRTETGLTREELIPVVFVPLVAGLPKSGRKPDGSDGN